MMKTYFLYFITLLFLFSCGKKKELPEGSDRFNEVASYIEEHGDFINSNEVPALIEASQLFAQMNGNTLMIDLRPEEEYNLAHIPFSVNIRLNGLIDYFENVIDPFSFDSIVLISIDGQASSYALSLLRLLGYENVYGLRWGLSAWHSSFANANWSAVLSSAAQEKLITNESPQKKEYSYPELVSDEDQPYAVIRERSRELLDLPFNTKVIFIDQLLKNPERYYIVGYLNEKFYKLGHIKGAVRYEPKKSLSVKTELHTLPADKTIVVYCFSGQHSAAVVAYLNLLGYDALSLKYGANSFIYQLLKENEGSVFLPEGVNEYPLIEGEIKISDEFKIENNNKKAASSQGGC